ncbi:PKD domain-containing protein, partial [uncultured Tenacibaculum sp.]|uniref:PKD domain-containing protein n=1 Tax=uncultured Tenacibaculum sp. TaxID=174713 RepID=UPI00359361A7
TGTSHTFTGLGANTYVVEVIDNKGCTDTVNTTILPQVTVTATSTPEDCNLGTITSVGAGGTGTGYVYAVVADGVTPVAGDFAAGNASVDRAAGTYDVYVEDSNGCRGVFQDVVVGSVTPVTASVTDTQPSCSTDTGSLSITVSEGTPPYTINITGASTITRTGVGTTSENFTGLGDGTYNIEVVDSEGCNFTTTETITVPAALTGGGASATDLSCTTTGGTNLGSISFTDPTGGTGSYVYFYKLTSSATFLSSTTSPVTGLAAGTYDVLIEDTNGCGGFTDTVTIADLPAV